MEVNRNMSEAGPREGQTHPADGAAATTGVGAVVIDADPLRGRLLAAWLAARHDLATVGLWHTLADAAAASPKPRPALALIAPDLPDGDGLRLLREGLPARATVVLVAASREHGPRRLPEGVTVVTVDRDGDPTRLAREIDRFIAAAGLSTPAVLVDSRLSPRERDVLFLIGEGLQSTAIAARLGMSRLTVETHRKSIARKLGVTGAGLVRRAALHLATNCGP